MAGTTYLLDYGAGNVLSVVNAVEALGHELKFIREPADFDKATRLIFPGVGAFGACMERLEVGCPIIISLVRWPSDQFSPSPPPPITHTSVGLLIPPFILL